MYQGLQLPSQRLITKSALWHENLTSEARINVNQGGTSSGKTYSLIDMFFYIAITEPRVVITVCGQDIPNLKAGAFRDAVEIWQNPEYKSYFSINRSDRIFTCINGSIIEFKSYADEQDAKSGKRDYLFMNEANGISYEIYWQLAIRTKKRIFLDYNPTTKFWVHEKLVGQPDVRLIISDHRHNLFISEELHQRIEAIEDPERFKVYARGLTGKIEGLLYLRFREYDIIPYDPANVRKNYTDTADTGADYLCSICYTETPTGCYITEILYTKKPMEYTEEATADMIVDNGTQICYIESNNGGRGFGRNVEEKTIKRGKIDCLFEPFHQGNNKISRINTASSGVQNIIYYPRGWESRWREFARDVKSYRKEGKNAHDDAPDVLSGIVERFTTEIVTEEKIQDDLIELMKMQGYELD